MAMKLNYFVDKSNDLKSRYSDRDDLYVQVENQNFFESDELDGVKGKAETVKITLSPDPHNQLKSAVQMMSAIEPKFRVPEGKNFSGDESKIETFIQTLWTEANKLTGSSVLYDLVYSALLYGEVHLGTIDMLDYLGYYKKKGGAYERRAKRAAKRSPFMFPVYNAHSCYTEFDHLGLVSHYRKYDVTAKKVAGEWGDAGIKAVKSMQDKDTVTYNEWWDLENHVVWLDEGVEILNEEHELPFIPIETAITDGSQGLFNKTSYQRQPFLYAVAKSGLWERQNLTLSALYTMIFAIGFSPFYAYSRSEPGKDLELDFSGPFGVVNLDPNESFTALNRNIIDPSVQYGMETANQLMEDSTIYRTARGQSIGANAAYSTHALLAQSGRLPLITPQKRIEWVLSQTMEKCLERLNESRSSKSDIEALLDEVELPESVTVETTLDVKLPQDKLQAANIATALKQVGLVSDEWIQSNLLNIEQPEQMRKQIWGETMAQTVASTMQQAEVQKIVMQMQAQQQAQAQPQAPQGAPALTPEAEAQMAGGGMPPEMRQEMQPPTPPMI